MNLLSIVVGAGIFAYNPRRCFFSSMSQSGKIAYHLFHVDYSDYKSNPALKLLKKAKWHQHTHASYIGNLGYFDDNDFLLIDLLTLENFTSGLDFHSDGETIATFYSSGLFLITDVNTDNCSFQIKMGTKGGNLFFQFAFLLLIFIVIIKIMRVVVNGVLALESPYSSLNMIGTVSISLILRNASIL